MGGLSSDVQAWINKHVITLPNVCTFHPESHLTCMKGQEPFCPECAKERVERQKQEVVDKAAQKVFHRHHQQTLRLDSIFDDREMIDSTFDTYYVDRDTEAYENWMQARRLATKYLNPDYKANTIFSGNPGTGKTHLAMAILNAINGTAEPEMMCLFISVNEVVRRVKNGFNKKDSYYTEERMTRLMGDADVLVLDDLGSESVMTRNSNKEASDWVQGFLFGVLNKRAGRTIITTNYDASKLTDTYNSKLVSRIYRGAKKNGGFITFTDETTDKRLEMY